MDDIQDIGVVTGLNGAIVTVEIQRGGGCQSCVMRGFCFSKNTPAKFILTSTMPLQIGDKVALDISPSGRVLASLLIFGVPLLFLFAGYILASTWMSELSSIFVAFAATALSFVLIRMCDARWGKKLKIEIARKL